MRCDPLYLDDMAEEQGNLFVTVVNNNYDLLAFMSAYAETELRRNLDLGIAWYCTMFGTELFDLLCKNKCPMFKSTQVQSPFVAEWLGVFYAYAQWYTNISYVDLLQRLLPIEIIQRYGALHDLDVQEAVRRVLQSELYNKKEGNIK